VLDAQGRYLQSYDIAMPDINYAPSDREFEEEALRRARDDAALAQPADLVARVRR